MSFDWLKIVDPMIVAKGTRNEEGYYKATLTSTEILEAVSGVITQPNHRNVQRFVKAYYPESSFTSIGTTGREGWMVYIKIRTK